MPVALKQGALGSGTWKTAVTGKVAILVGSAPQIYEDILAGNPVNFWPIRDAQGQVTCNDLVGTKDTVYSGSNVLTQHAAPGVPFSSGNQQFISIPGGNPVRDCLTTGFTIECVFKSIYAGSIFGYQNAPAPGAVVDAEGYVPAIYIDTSGVLRVTIYPLQQLGEWWLASGKYEHIALTWSPTDSTLRLYINGILRASTTGTPAFVTWPGDPNHPAAFNNYAQIGASYSNAGWTNHANTGWWYFDGEIALFAVYNRALTAVEIGKRWPPDWKYPATIKLKSGALGSGSWRDSGYVGIPGTPAAPTVLAWDYYNIHLRWDDPVGGAPVESYESQLRLSDNTVSATATVLTKDMYSQGRNQWEHRWANLNAGWQYKMRIRAKSAGGIFSPWSADTQVQMGYAAYEIPHSSYETRPWYTNWYTDPAGAGAWIVCPVAPNVSTWQLGVRVALANGSTPFSGSAAGRKANWVINSGDGGYCGFKNSPWDEDVPWGVSANAWNGIWLAGTGWSASGGWLGYGTIHIWGTETYLYQWTQYVAAVPNGYW